MRAFRRVVLVLGSVLLTVSVASAQARLGPYVVDSNGLKVGHLYDANTVLMFIDGVPTTVAAALDGFHADPSPFDVFFTDPACGTTPLAGSSDGTGALINNRGHYTTDGVIRYASTPTGTPGLLIQSKITVSTDGSLGPCEPDVFGGFTGTPVASFSASVFTPPFSVVDTLPVSPAPGSATFNDVPTDHPFFRFIEALYASGITAGCQAAPPLYCPDNPVTRGQMAVFLAKALGL
jgi:hypothetical protein